VTTPSGGVPCGWTIDTSCVPDWSTFSPALQTLATNWAIRQLWQLSGRRFSACEITVRPCQPAQWQSYETFGVWRDDMGGSGAGSWIPYVGTDGQWRNCSCSGWCCCRPACEVWLPGPVASITSVTVDGVTLATGWRVEDLSFLVREDGGCWPDCQDFNLPAGAVGTFVVTYVRGDPVPDDAAIAVGKLAGEYAKFCTGGTCALSPTITSLSRDGVSFEVVTPQQNPQYAPTGVAVADAWLRAVNPSGLRQRPRVETPDLPSPRVTTFP
jgi:hypothetical protein